MKYVETRAQSEKRALKLSLEEVESRATKGELVRVALEGEVQRLKHIISEREAEIQSVFGQTENQMRVIHDLEQKFQSVEATNNNLNRIVTDTQTELELHRSEVISFEESISFIGLM